MYTAQFVNQKLKVWIMADVFVMNVEHSLRSILVLNQPKLMNLNKAIQIATHSASQSTEKHRMGAILFDKSKFVTASNRTFAVKVPGKTTPYSEHAEASVINHALHSGIDIKKSTLVIVRINRKGSLMLAKPCRHCQKLIGSVGIQKIYYSQDPLRREINCENFKSIGE